MSELTKACLSFLILCGLSLVLIQIGQTPTGTDTTNGLAGTTSSAIEKPLSILSSWVALPHNVFVKSAANIRQYSSSILTKRNQQETIDLLEEEVANLKNEQRQLELELENYQQILGVRVFQSPAVFGTADIIGVSSGALQNTFTINKGNAEQILPFMPVTVPEGLVGIVTQVQEHKAIVRTILDPNSRVGVTVEGKAGQGIAVGQLDGNLRITDYFEEDTIKVGDLVETQSRKGLFPRGLALGTVIEILEPDPNSLTIEFIVKPAADIQNLLAITLINPL